MKFSTAISILSAAGGAWADHPVAGPEAAMAEKPTAMQYEAPASAAAYMPDEMMAGTTAAAYGMTTAAAYEMATDAAKASAGAAAVTHTVEVGGPAGLMYKPSEIQAKVGDVVQFVMLIRNHTATESTFDKPCVRKADGVDSGFLPSMSTNATDPAAPKFDYTVESLEPTWWYCRQRNGTHCGKGMVFSINANKDKSFEEFKAKAIAQNGTDAAAPTGTGEPAKSAPVTLTVDNGGLPPATSTAAVAPPAQTMIAPGWNNQGNQGVICACFCGVAAYPANMGVGSYGGMGGVMAAPW